MGPKAKGKGGKGKAAAVIIDGVNTSEMTREQLEAFAVRLKDELEREREERNFFQLERDKLRTFWEITKNDLEEANAKLRNKDHEIEVLSEKNDDEIKKYHQKEKHLRYEHKTSIAELRAEAMVTLKGAQDDYLAQENELLRDKKDLKEKLHQQEEAHYLEIKQLKLKHCEEISNERQRCLKMLENLEIEFEKHSEKYRSETRTKHATEITEIEVRKNKQIKNLIEKHGKSMQEMKNYYHDITLNNLAIISSLKEQMEELSKQNDRMAKNVTTDDQKLAEPLRIAQAEVKEFKKQLENYEKDKTSLANTISKFKAKENEIKDLRWTHEALRLSYDKLSEEKNYLKDCLVKEFMDMQLNTSLKYMILQRKIDSLMEILNSTDSVFGELVPASSIKIPATSRKLEDLVKKRNNIIKDLQLELSKICQAHDDLLIQCKTTERPVASPQSEPGYNSSSVQIIRGQSKEIKLPPRLTR